MNMSLRDLLGMRLWRLGPDSLKKVGFAPEHVVAAAREPLEARARDW